MTKRILKIKYLLYFLIISIFLYRNLDRIIQEKRIYEYSPVWNVYYYVDENHHFRVEREFKNVKKFYNDCTKLNVS